ncbi:MAG: dephospho-CoA kinase, partial [Micrococcaceae bacterium]|nr:dephospho-CoA kinase [Micrococcaceae bacterium]
MLDVGLTGGIASGKSAVATRLAERGAVLIDADAIARRVLEPGTEGLAAVVEAFGPDLVDADGEMDRARLGGIVFAHPQARETLNGIVHPRVRAEAARIRGEAADRETADRPVVVVQDIPLLVETGQAASFDVVVTVQAPRAERVRRMVQDRGMGEDDAVARMAAQATDEQRAAVSDVVLENSGTLQELQSAVDDLWTGTLQRLAGRPGPRDGDPG